MSKRTMTKSDIETCRSIPDLRKWVDRVMGSLSRIQLLLRQDPYVKEFFEEIYPALVYLEARYTSANDICYSPQMGNQPYDGVVTRGDSVVEYIECTFAIDGQLEFRRREQLRNTGQVALNTAPAGYIRGQKWPGTQIPEMTVNSEQIVAQLIPEICNRVCDKVNTFNANSSRYVSPTTLVVAFQSPLQQDHAKRIYSSVKHAVANVPNPFSGIWLVSLLRGPRACQVYP